MFTLKELINALGSLVLDTTGQDDCTFTAATDDSRAVTPGALFCAIKGAKADGHDFIQSALANGAAGLVLTRIPEGIPQSIPCIIVSNDYRAAGITAELAAGFPAHHFKVLAVTGTNGKTTSAYLLRDILKKAGFRTAMLGTVEYDLGNGKKIVAERTTPTPFFLQKLFYEVYNNSVHYCVMELSSHALEQQRLGNLKVDGAIFTNLTQEHLDYHQSLENYYQAKKRLFTHHLKSGAPAIVNADDPFGKRLADELAHNLAKEDVISFSLKNLCTPVCVHVKNLKLSAQGTECALSFPEGDWSLTSPLAGLYNGYNLAGVAILAHELGLPNPTVAQALATCLGAPGRLQKIDLHQRFNCFVDYAHTPDALENVMGAVRKLTHNRLIVVFGCGGDRDRTKRPLMGKAVSCAADVAIVTSDNPRTENPDDIIGEILPGMTGHAIAILKPDRREAIAAAVSMAEAGDSIIIAGKGHEDYQEVNGVKHHFSDAECAAELIAALAATATPENAP